MEFIQNPSPYGQAPGGKGLRLHRRAVPPKAELWPPLAAGHAKRNNRSRDIGRPPFFTKPTRPVLPGFYGVPALSALRSRDKA